MQLVLPSSDADQEHGNSQYQVRSQTNRDLVYLADPSPPSCTPAQMLSNFRNRVVQFAGWAGKVCIVLGSRIGERLIVLSITIEGRLIAGILAHCEERLVQRLRLFPLGPRFHLLN
jgi:hypothetical protein